ncbi:hypothetical protein [Streptomyces sp. NPDC046371]|uniref:hypothetical protein n=1 Tax=Streptomyces sp. NPDC046371 TaxID=3154916 RepID=UPI003406A8F3
MGDTSGIDQDAVLRARVLLLGSGRLDPWQEVGAYRVLAEVSPRAYLPKLVGALLAYVHRVADQGSAAAPAGEAVAAARRLDPGTPHAAELLGRALSAHEYALFSSGRRAEGRAVSAERAENGAFRRWATVLAEEGRHAEAAEVHERHLGGAEDTVSGWALIEWAGALDAAGRRERALEVFGRLVADGRRGVAADRGPLAVLVWELHGYAGMLRAAGRRAEAASVRAEALGLLDRLARDGEPVSWSNVQASWITLFTLSGREDEPAATAEVPLPAFGCYSGHGWSPDVREAWFASVPDLEGRADALRATGDLPGLLAVQRRLTVRRALLWETRGRRTAETLLPSYDEGIALARRLPGSPSALARALADRAMFLVAVERYGDARRDFADALALPDVPVSPMSHPTSAE